MTQEIYWVGGLGLHGIMVILIIYGMVNKKINGMVNGIKKDIEKRALASEEILKHETIDHNFDRINGNLNKIFDKIDEQTKILSTLVGKMEGKK